MHLSWDEDEEDTSRYIRKEFDRLSRMDSLLKMLLILPFASTVLIIVIMLVLLTK